MAQYIIQGSTLTDIADSIRYVTDTSEMIPVLDMAAKIRSAKGGGGGGSAEGFHDVTFMNGGEPLLTRPVYDGDDCPDPVTQGRIDKPTKESTVDTVYTHNGWAAQDESIANDEVLKNITEDRTLYAAFKSDVRMYTVRFFDGNTLLKTEEVEYGKTPAYFPTKDGYSFNGWTPTLAPVTANVDYTALWNANPTFSGSSWSDISEVCESGQAATYFSVGDKRTITNGNYTYVLRIIGIGLDEKADGSGKAGITVMVDSPATDEMQFASVKSISSGWDGTTNTIRPWLHNTFINRLPSDLSSVIKTVNKTTGWWYEGAQSPASTQDKLFIPSLSETGNSSSSNNDGTGIVYEGIDSTTERIFKNESGTAITWWLRSLHNGNARYVNTTGTCGTNQYDVDSLSYIRPCFCI